MTAKVFEFPKGGRSAYNPDPKSIEVKPDALSMTMVHCDTLLDECLDEVGYILDDGGLATPRRDNALAEDALLLEMMLQSMIYRMAGVHHPLHDVHNALINVSKDGYEKNGYKSTN